MSDPGSTSRVNVGKSAASAVYTAAHAEVAFASTAATSAEEEANPQFHVSLNPGNLPAAPAMPLKPQQGTTQFQVIPPAAFVKLLNERVKDPTKIEKIIQKYPQIVTLLKKHQHLENIDDAASALGLTRKEYEDVLPCFAIFLGFYADLITDKYVRSAVRNKLVINGEPYFFTRPDFMEILPARFAELYFEAAYMFFTDPERLAHERPIWYQAFSYALEGNKWALMHGMVGIVAHIKRDLAIGIADTVVKLAMRDFDTDDPKLAAKLALENREWLDSLKIDHDYINALLTQATTEAVEQFVRRGDPLSYAFQDYDSPAKFDGRLTRWAMSVIAQAREEVWVDMIGILAARAITEEPDSTSFENAIVFEMDDEAAAIGEVLTQPTIKLDLKLIPTLPGQDIFDSAHVTTQADEDSIIPNLEQLGRQLFLGGELNLSDGAVGYNPPSPMTPFQVESTILPGAIQVLVLCDQDPDPKKNEEKILNSPDNFRFIAIHDKDAYEKGKKERQKEYDELVQERELLQLADQIDRGLIPAYQREEIFTKNPGLEEELQKLKKKYQVK